MERRWIAVGLSLTLGLSGCQSMGQALRHSSTEKAASQSDDDDVERVKSEAPKGFFKNSRLSGAMSSEGRDIERSLGVQ
jgi:hypothetical protein